MRFGLLLIGRLHSAAARRVKRKICSVVCCEPDWPHPIACGLDRPLCRRCGDPV